VVWPMAAGEQLFEVKGKALEQGFADAAVLASMEILPGSLSEKQQALLREYLAPRTREFVLSYAELSHEQTWTELTLTLDVRINRQVLKNLLQEIGLFYTSAEPWPYSLTLSGGLPGDFLAVDDLQALTGLVIRHNADPALSLHRDGADVWRGELSTGGRVITEVHQDLRSLWSRIWRQYFNLPEVQARVMSTAVLFTEGWGSVREAAAFDVELNGWDRLVERAQLTEIDIGADAVTGRWVLTVRSSELLMESLKNRLAEQGIRYSFRFPDDERPNQTRP
jgi:hypothetical protein